MRSASTSSLRTRGDVQPLLERLVATGQETGIQVAAYLDGDLVVDAWASVADPETAVEAEVRAGLGLPAVPAMDGS